MKKICILDYGLGNIKSLYNSLVKIGYKPEFYSNTNYQSHFDFIFIPGVGSFSKGSNLILNKYLNFLENAKKNGSTIFGICLGMQLLLSEGEENGKNKGLNFIAGKVTCLDKKKKIRLPVVGWQNVIFNNLEKYSFLKKYDNKKFYFVHSYAAQLNRKEHVLSTSTYKNINYCSSIIGENCIGTQFHPEKSGEIGLEFISDFIRNFK